MAAIDAAVIDTTVIEMIDVARFKQIAYAIARAADAEVLRLREAGITPNFHAAELRLRYDDNIVCMLCTRDALFALSRSMDPPLDFIDHEELSTASMSLYGFRVRTRAELTAPFRPTPDVLAADIAYWRPQTVGDALFNWWD